MKAQIKIMLKKGVLDPQGKAIGQALGHLGFSGISDVRMGKIIEIEVGNDTSEAEIKKMCDQLLANPVIEDFEISLQA
jgi:phosphoribosylformylglycinamidine synthase subunit PurS